MKPQVNSCLGRTLRDMRYQKAFTLVEILIVVAILGILAAVVIPELQGHSQKAKESAAKETLQMLRTAIERYAIQHNGIPPGYTQGDMNNNPLSVNFFVHMTMASNAAHEIAPPGTPGYPFGPYISKFPKNPFNNLDSRQMIPNGGEMPAEPTGQYGWIYQAATKTIRLDWPGTDSAGIAYYDY